MPVVVFGAIVTFAAVFAPSGPVPKLSTTTVAAPLLPALLRSQLP
jgi:hypothetical protein